MAALLPRNLKRAAGREATSIVLAILLGVVVFLLLQGHHDRDLPTVIHAELKVQEVPLEDIKRMAPEKHDLRRPMFQPPDYVGGVSEKPVWPETDEDRDDLTGKNMMTNGVYPPVDFDTVKEQFLKIYKGIPKIATFNRHIRNTDCKKQRNPSLPCVDSTCNASVSTDPVDDLRELLEGQYRVPEKYVAVLKKLANQITGKTDVVFVTGASANHFRESEGLIQSLHKNVFPVLEVVRKSFKLYFYDLGLETSQREILKNHCRCQVMDFPFEELPVFHRRLKCYGFKSVIQQIHFPSADILIWADSSLRFTGHHLLTTLAGVSVRGLALSPGSRSVAQQTSLSTFQYFGESACRYSKYAEAESGFVAYKNNAFVASAVLGSLVSCAFKEDCLCPKYTQNRKTSGCNPRVRKYGNCHRFDQSVINIVAVKLFRENTWSFFSPRGRLHVFQRGGYVSYFPKSYDKNFTKS